MNPAEAAQVVDVLAHAGLRYTPELSPGTYALWADQLRDFPVAVGVKAARRLIAQDQDWPAIARFRELAKAELAGWAPPQALEQGPAVYRCGKCFDTGLQEASPDEFHPCPRCNAEGYEKWSSSGYRTKRFTPRPGTGEGVVPPAVAQVRIEELRQLIAR